MRQRQYKKHPLLVIIARYRMALWSCAALRMIGTVWRFRWWLKMKQRWLKRAASTRKCSPRSRVLRNLS